MTVDDKDNSNNRFSVAIQALRTIERTASEALLSIDDGAPLSEEIDCRSDEGVTIGLIDAIISVAREVAEDLARVRHALKLQDRVNAALDRLVSQADQEQALRPVAHELAELWRELQALKGGGRS